MVITGPVGPIGDDGQPVVEVPQELLDEDLAWLARFTLGRQVRRVPPQVSLTPDPGLSQQVWR